MKRGASKGRYRAAVVSATVWTPAFAGVTMIWNAPLQQNQRGERAPEASDPLLRKYHGMIRKRKDSRQIIIPVLPTLPRSA
jgi:hypothetical protein